MYFMEQIKKYNNKKVLVYVDMDGVIADYEVGKPYNFKDKRPLLSSINKLEEISKLENVCVNILSVCRKDFQIDEKNEWLDKYASFFKIENRNILSKENNDKLSKELKLNYLKSVNELDSVIILIDDDNEVLKYIKSNTSNVILFQDSALVD